ncbi:MAG: hypothetical protein ACQEVA_03730 [Myxococcota bacterium]
MLIVTGTKRSGTSMWMQILKESGLQLIGEAFPKNWGETLHEANPHGFYESPLRRGVFYATNPHPQNGHYLAPNRTTNVAVKIFIPGLCRTDLAYIDRVIGTMRHWREYTASIERMREMEDEAAEERGREGGPPERLDPVLEWWLENFALIRNIVTRKYPAYLTTYERVVEEADDVLPPILEWLGAEDIDAGIAAVSPETRTQNRDRIERSHEFEDVFDELYAIVQSSEPMSNAFLEKMNETHQELVPVIEEDRKRVMRDHIKRRRKRRRQPDALHPDALEAMIHRDPDDHS